MDHSNVWNSIELGNNIHNFKKVQYIINIFFSINSNTCITVNTVNYLLWTQNHKKKKKQYTRSRIRISATIILLYVVILLYAHCSSVVLSIRQSTLYAYNLCLCHRTSVIYFHKRLSRYVTLRVYIGKYYYFETSLKKQLNGRPLTLSSRQLHHRAASRLHCVRCIYSITSGQ